MTLSVTPQGGKVSEHDFESFPHGVCDRRLSRAQKKH
jgi:hypothetical protein